MFAIQTDREWRRFCEIVMGAASLASDARFSTNGARVENRDALETMIESSFRTQQRSAVSERLQAADIPMASMNDVPAVAAHAQLASRKRWTTVDSPGGPIPALIPPHNIAGAAPRMGRVPLLGEHTSAIRAEMTAR